MSYFRPEIEAMQGYVPGEQPQGGKFIKLNTNENPYPPSPAVKRAIAAVLERGLARYPDPHGRAPFAAAPAEVLGVEPDWILCGNGSDDILTIVTRALVGQAAMAAAAVSQLHPLQARWPSCRARGAEEVSFRARLVAARQIRRAAGRLEAGVSAQSQQPLGHDAPSRAGSGTGRAAALPAAGRRGVRRFRRHELPVAGRPDATRSWSRAR